jgi:hypothetical protein
MVSKLTYVFAKGFGMHNNPYFNNHALRWYKESFFIIKAEELDLM